MTMTTHEIREYVLEYLKTTECNIQEESEHHVTVKLSTNADRELTNRPYYWAYVDRCGVEPETMSYTFVFDSNAYDELEQMRQTKAPVPVSHNDQRLMNRVPPLPILGPNRIQREDLSFGSSRLQQIFQACKKTGSFLYVFENPGSRQRHTLLPASYEPWLGICFKVEYLCDMKREEIHYFGISLSSGQVETQFKERIERVPLQQRLPENVSILPTMLNLEEGKIRIEQLLRSAVETKDHSWAEAARGRLHEELGIIDAYYSHLLTDEKDEDREKAKGQYEARIAEIRWQFEPRVSISVINCGIFHLRAGT